MPGKYRRPRMPKSRPYRGPRPGSTCKPVALFPREMYGDKAHWYVFPEDLDRRRAARTPTAADIEAPAQDELNSSATPLPEGDAGADAGHDAVSGDAAPAPARKLLKQRPITKRSA